MGATGSRPVVLDAGALIAIERGNDYVVRLVQLAGGLHIPAGALAQAWRDPRPQVRLVRTVAAQETVVHALDGDAAKAAGQLCALTGTRDVVDASIVQVARSVDGIVVTSDPDDLRRLDPSLAIVGI